MSAIHLDRTFAALADPTRRAILARLASGPRTVGELAAPFDMTLPAVSKHLRVLAEAGLIERGRDGRHRPCKLDPRPLRLAADWLARQRAAWEQRLDQLDAYLRELDPNPRRRRP
jgi:DNA-binding transcriptional ArsR family regulator